MGRKESIKQNNESQKEREEYMEPSGFQELEIESHREAQALCAENLLMEISNKNCSEEELKIDRDNFESTDEIELKETNTQTQIIRPHVPIDGDKNKRNDNIDEENKGEMDKELKNNKIVTEKIETEEENPEKDKKIHKISKYLKNRKDLPNQPDPTADHSSHEDKKGRESVKTADKSTQNDNSESAVTVSHEDNLGIKAVKELEEKIHKLEEKINRISKYIRNKKDLPNQPDLTADHSSQEVKTGLDSVKTTTDSTQNNNS